jgi:phosphomannomutase
MGGRPVRTQVGHSIIKKVMADTGAVFGGEHSGHYYYRDNFRADSGIITALVVLELLSKSDVPLSAMLRPYERYADSGEINTVVVDPAATVAAITEAERAAGAAVDLLDGVTVERDDWWYNVRPSNTEPLLRLNVEARTPELCAAHVAEVQALIAENAGRSG